MRMKVSDVRGHEALEVRSDLNSVVKMNLSSSGDDQLMDLMAQ